ncbi:MAG TPA: tetratricopeptide repeat protein, partial [Polyangiaceae bacterium]
MTDLAPSAEDRFGADPEATSLVQGVALSSGFQFVLVYCESSFVVDELATWLEGRVAMLRETPTERFRRIEVTPHHRPMLSLAELIDQVLAPLLSTSTAEPRPILVNASVIDRKHDPIWHAFLERMNERRNAIQKRLHASLILALPERFAQVFPSLAPDLWSVRSLEVTIDASQYAAPKDPQAFQITEMQISEPTVVSQSDSADALVEASTLSAELNAAEADYKAHPDDTRVRRRLAIWLERAAAHAQKATRYEEARDYAARAKTILESLVGEDASHPLLPELARNLGRLATLESALGQREAAWELATKAVDIGRRLSAARPDAFLPDLAMSLSNLGNSLSELGQREAALVATQEAVEHRRKLAAQRPDAFLPNLAASLNNLGNRLNALGRREAALDATEEAVEQYRKLAAERPDAFLPNLAASLNNLGNRLNALGRREAALDATEEAVEQYRKL